MKLYTKEQATPKLHDYLLSAVAPRPIAFVSTVNENGDYNLAPFSFFNVFGSNPPILVFSPARSGRTAATKNTHDNIKLTNECVVNIAHKDMLHQMNLAAGMYPKGVNEFEKSGLSAVKSELVKPPRVGESFVSFECKVTQIIETGELGGAGNLIICEVVLIHVQDQVLDADQNIDPFKMNYIARMGRQYWCSITKENMFAVPAFKMVNDLGIGFDGLPNEIRKSKTLSGNELAQLASLSSLPSPDEIKDWKMLNSIHSTEQAELFAKEKISQSEWKEALIALMSVLD